MIAIEYYLKRLDEIYSILRSLPRCRRVDESRFRSERITLKMRIRQVLRDTLFLLPSVPSDYRENALIKIRNVLRPLMFDSCHETLLRTLQRLSDIYHESRQVKGESRDANFEYALSSFFLSTIKHSFEEEYIEIRDNEDLIVLLQDPSVKKKFRKLSVRESSRAAEILIGLLSQSDSFSRPRGLYLYFFEKRELHIHLDRITERFLRKKLDEQVDIN